MGRPPPAVVGLGGFHLRPAGFGGQVAAIGGRLASLGVGGMTLDDETTTLRFRKARHTMNYLYCIRVGHEDRFKIGHSKSPHRRLQNLSSGNDRRLNYEREVATLDAKEIEAFIHALLAPHRTDTGEFFDISLAEFDAALERAQRHLAESKSIREGAQSLRTRKPVDPVRPPSADELALCRELKSAKARAFLLAEEIAILESKLQIAVGDSLGLEGIVWWKWEETLHFNQQLFRKAHPKLFKSYMRVRSCRVFRLANAKPKNAAGTKSASMRST